jgi:NADPH-dependent 2,4-dienoyl-CoA reductase/sulfur reductase-like enzyme
VQPRGRPTATMKGGIRVALRARELDPNLEVPVLLADSYPNFGICCLAFFVRGQTPDWR